MPYIHFTEEQKLRASEVDLVEFLRHQGEKLIRSGPEYRLASDHSITVQGNEWYDHAIKEGGGPISFVQQFYNLSYPEAITCLLGGEQGIVYASAQKQEEKPRKEFALPSAGREMRRMYAYLLKHRFLDRNVVNAFVRAGLLYESCEKFKDREYHNAVFVGKDENGVPRHAHKRSLNSLGKTFRINVEGSDPRCSFHYTGTSNRLYVFEAPIDLMSFLSRYPRGWQEHSFVALCGTAEHAMLWMLERNPCLRTVCLCLDHDEAGIEASGRLAEILHEHGYDDVGMLQSEHKDWNEDLKARRGLPAQEAEEHPQLIAATEVCGRISVCMEECVIPDRLGRELTNALCGYEMNLHRDYPEGAMSCIELASALALYAYGRGPRQLGEPRSGEELVDELRGCIRPHQNRGSVKNRINELAEQAQNVLEKVSKSGIRSEAEKRELTAVTWELTRDGKSIAMPEGFTKDGGICYFMEAGRYVLRGTVENIGGTAYCEKMVEVLPIGDIAFFLPEYGYTDRAEDVKLLTKNDLTGSVVWTLMKDGANQPLASFTKEGGTLALAETGKYTLTATLTDAAGKQYTASQSITILPVIVPTVTASTEKVHDGETAEIGLTVEGGKPESVRWTLTRDGKEVPVTLSANGGTLTFDGAGDHILTAIAKDSQGREFSSEPVTIRVIPNLPLSLTSDQEKLHEDEAAEISLTVEHGTPSTVQWALTRDGEGAPVSLDDNGGTLTFDAAGDYVLTATITDELGKEYTAALPLEVCPVIVLTLDAPETAHIDQPAAVSLTGTDLDVTWEVTSEDGAVVENALTNSGGEITFPSAGNYTVTASVTDHLGRTFSASATISVWDTMGLSFKLPEFAHPDETVKVKMTSENVGDSKIAWSLTVDGQPVSLPAGIAGTLDNAGG